MSRSIFLLRCTHLSFEIIRYSPSSCSVHQFRQRVPNGVRYDTPRSVTLGDVERMPTIRIECDVIFWLFLDLGLWLSAQSTVIFPKCGLVSVIIFSMSISFGSLDHWLISIFDLSGWILNPCFAVLRVESVIIFFALMQWNCHQFERKMEMQHMLFTPMLIPSPLSFHVPMSFSVACWSTALNSSELSGSLCFFSVARWRGISPICNNGLCFCPPLWISGTAWIWLCTITGTFSTSIVKSDSVPCGMWAIVSPTRLAYPRPTLWRGCQQRCCLARLPVLWYFVRCWAYWVSRLIHFASMLVVFSPASSPAMSLLCLEPYLVSVLLNSLTSLSLFYSSSLLFSLFFPGWDHSWVTFDCDSC